MKYNVKVKEKNHYNIKVCNAKKKKKKNYNNFTKKNKKKKSFN